MQFVIAFFIYFLVVLICCQVQPALYMIVSRTRSHTNPCAPVNLSTTPCSAVFSLPVNFTRGDLLSTSHRNPGLPHSSHVFQGDEKKPCSRFLLSVKFPPCFCLSLGLTVFALSYQVDIYLCFLLRKVRHSKFNHVVRIPLSLLSF